MLLFTRNRRFLSSLKAASYVSFALASLAFLSACPPPNGPGPQVGVKTVDGSTDTSTKPKEPPKPVPVDRSTKKEAEELYKKLYAAHQAKDAAAAAEYQRTMFSAYTHTDSAAKWRIFLAREAVKIDAPAKAIELLQKVLTDNAGFADLQRVRFELIQLYKEQGRIKEGLALLQLTMKAERDKSVVTRWEPLLIEWLLKTGQADQALTHQLELYRSLSDVQQRKALEAKILQAVDGGIGVVAIRRLYETLKADKQYEFPFALVGFKLSKVLYHMRDYQQAKMIIDELRTLAKDDPWTDRTDEIIALVNARLETKPTTVGVILPLSGRFALFGKAAKAAIELAFERRQGITLIFRDSEGKPVKAAKQVEELVLQEKVICIIGPLVGKSARSAALKAEDLETPIMLLSFHAGLHNLGGYVFRNALTAKQQAQSIAKVAFDKLGFTRFAIFHPDALFGREMAKAFWEEVETRKGEIRGIEKYPHDATNFQLLIKKMVGRYWLDARWEYRSKFWQIKGRHLPPHREQQAMEKLRKNLAPVTDFDAILIPDNPKLIGLIAPALAFEDIILTHDPKELKKIKKATGRKNLKPVTLLGTSAWNHPDTITRGQKYVEDSIFVDNFYLDNPDTRVRDFVTAFREKTSGTPHITDAQAFDSGLYIANVIDRFSPKSRNDMRNALIQLKDFKGVTGLKGFAENGEGIRELFVFTIKDQEIKLLSDEDLPKTPGT